MRVTVAVMFLSFMVLAGCGGEVEKMDTAAGDETEPAPEVTKEIVQDEEEALNKPDPAGTYGAGVGLTETVAIAAIHREPESYEGKTVVVEGTVSDVCPNRGCWVDLVDAQTNETIRVKVTDGYIVFPLSAKGKHARVEGTVEKLELTEEQARNWREHEAEELGRSFDPESVTGPEVIWRIKGSGAEIEG